MSLRCPGWNAILESESQQAGDRSRNVLARFIKKLLTAHGRADRKVKNKSDFRAMRPVQVRDS